MTHKKEFQRQGVGASTPILGTAKILKILAVAVGASVMVWGLFYLSAPPTHLEPYTKYKKTSGELPASNPDAQPAESLEGAGGPDPAEKPGPEKVAEVAASAEGPPLPPETLQQISLGMMLTDQGKFELAHVAFEKAAELSPKSAEVYSIWGASLRMQEKFKGANKRFAIAHELAPDDDEIVFNWGLTRLHEKNADAAIDLFQKTIALNPRHYLAYNYLGKSHGLKKQYTEEEAGYMKALEIKEDLAQAHFNLAVVRSLQKNYEGAAPHFERAIELDKTFDQPFVIQFLTAMGLRKPGEGMKKARLKNPPKKGETQTAKLDTAPTEGKKLEGSGHNMEGSSSKIEKKVTLVKGRVTINGQPADERGVVFLETKDKLRIPNQTTQQIEIQQADLQFSPAHSVVQVGSILTFVNNDNEVHNIYSKSLNNQFNLGAMAGGTSKSMKMIAAGPVILRCNLHKDMIGTVFVVPNGYFTQTNAQGEFQFDSVKSQEYIMEFWHPQLYPDEVAQYSRIVSLTGPDKTEDFKIVSESKPGEIHDLVDDIDYNLLVDNIEKEIYQAIEGWKKGKKSIPHKRMLMAITKHYDGGGLKSAIAKSFSEKRSEKLETAMDKIRKKIAGIDKSEEVTEASLKFKAERVIAQLRTNVQELNHRFKPAP